MPGRAEGKGKILSWRKLQGMKAHHSEVDTQSTESRASNKYTCTHIQSSIIHKELKVEPSKYPSMDEWVNSVWSIHRWTMTQS